MKCCRCPEPAVSRAVVKSASGRIMLDDPVCAKHEREERTLGQFGMAKVEIVPLAAA